MAGKLWRRKIPFRFTPVNDSFFDWLPSLSRNEVCVYLGLMKFCWAVRKEGTDTIGISQLVDLTHIPRRSVDRALASLKSRGLLKVTGSVKKPRLYEVLMPKTMQESYAIAVAQEAGSVAPTIGASLTPKLWRTPKNRESGKLRIVE